jgi:hypothetical protein
MKKSSQDTDNTTNTPIKVRLVPQGRLQKLFEQHGNQFLKWNFLPFLNHKKRSSLRTSCALLKKFIPAPNFVYTKNQTQALSHQATARLEKTTGYVETRGSAEDG